MTTITMVATDSPNVQSLIQAVESADSAFKLIGAVRSLAAIQSAQAIPTLIAVLGFNNPGAAVAAVDGLAALGSEAVPTLLERLDGYDYGARAWAIRALAMIGDPRALDVLVETVRGDFALSVRRAAAKGLGFIDWQQLPNEEQLPSQTSALEALLIGLDDPEWVVRYAVVTGLANLMAAIQDTTRIEERLLLCSQTDPEIVVRARAQRALTPDNEH